MTKNALRQKYPKKFNRATPKQLALPRCKSDAKEFTGDDLHV